MIRGKLKQLPQLQQKQRETLIEKLNDSSNSQIRELVGESLIIQTEELEQERIWMESIYKEHLHDTEKLICGPTRLWESSQLTDLMIKQRLNSIINNIRKDLERTKGLEITLNQSTNFEFIKSKHPLNIKKIREYLESMKRYNEDRINDYQLKLDMEQEVRDHNLLVELSHTKDLTIFKKLLDTIEWKSLNDSPQTIVK
ncbi:hypothetical protein BC833DRAFT_31140 [Globomyces pollinis-pini]|nr:hypothetical protein BC833DRAFT_31140 [Globomyces pollinis-pini]